MEENRILLADMIEMLRSELAIAQSAGTNAGIKFSIDKIDLELSVAISREGVGKAGIKFWVVDAGGEFKKENSQTHTFKLSLKPLGAKGEKDFQVSNQLEGKISDQ